MTTSSEVFECKFLVLCSEFSHHLEFHTDGSKDGDRKDDTYEAD